MNVLQWALSSPNGECEYTATNGDDAQVADHVARAQAGEVEAFAFLYRRYLPAVFQFTLNRLGDPAAAEDATQTIFLRALSALPSCREHTAFAGWLFAIARGVVTDRLRSRRFSPAPLAVTPPVPDPRLGPEALALRSETSRLLYEARARCLNARERELFDLLLTDLNDKEIAMVLGRTHGATRTAHWRLLGKLRDCLGLESGKGSNV